jgi:hypothetical protein
MNKTKQRIAIAKACGWKDIKRVWMYVSDTSMEGYATLSGILTDNKREILPNYLEDLNTMHEAESIIYPRWDTYFSMLISVRWRDAGDHPADLSPARATAAQRAEAFLKTLNLWGN